MKSLDALFFKFVRCGLWNKASVIDSIPSEMEWKQLFVLFRQQAILGIFVSALENLKKEDVPEAIRMKAALSAVTLEKANAKLNKALAEVGKIFDENGILYTVVKGPSVAQCYDKPLWRAPGDIDLFMPHDSYEKAKQIIIPLADSVMKEGVNVKHYAFFYKGVEFELHGTMFTQLSNRIDSTLLSLQNKMFLERSLREWDNNGYRVLSPGINEDAVILFTHFVKHFFKKGLGLRQVCDWSQFLNRYYDKLDIDRLKVEIRELGLMSEWVAFASFAVDFLGHPSDKMPFYKGGKSNKARRIWKYLKRVGNFGQIRQDLKPINSTPYFVRKASSFFAMLKDVVEHTLLFPLDSISFFFYYLPHGFMYVVREKILRQKT
ncbi:MAG: nucleotidyltransferase family protein [Candidatus Egerieousia sp.]